MRLQLNYQPVSGISIYWPRISSEHPTVHPCIHTSFMYIICWLLHRQATDITWLSYKLAIRVCCFIYSYVLATKTGQRYHPDYSAIHLCGTVDSFVYASWMLHTNPADITWFPNCSSMSCFIHFPVNIG